MAHREANGCFDSLISEHQSVDSSTQAMSIYCLPPLLPQTGPGFAQTNSIPYNVMFILDKGASK